MGAVDKQNQKIRGGEFREEWISMQDGY